MRRIYVFTLVLLVLPALLTTFAQSPGRVKKGELKHRPFVAGALTLTITIFRPTLRDLPTLLRVPGQMEVRIENRTDQGAQYVPQDLAVVGSDGLQVNLRGRLPQGLLNPDDDRLEPLQKKVIAPGARVKEFYELTGSVRLPARLFYGAQELAMITD